MVRTPQIQAELALAGDCGELGDCVLRVCLSGAGESHRRELLHADATENHAGVHHAHRLYRLCVHRFPRATALEQPRLLCAAYRRGRVCFLAALNCLHSGVQKIPVPSPINDGRVEQGEGMALTILSVAYPLAPVGPDAVGGAEQVLTALDSALIRAGHQSLVLACEGSKTRGTLFPIRVHGSSLAETLESTDAQQRAAIEQVLREYPVNVVHMHGLNFLKYMPAEDVPVVVTLHLPPSYYSAETFSLRRPRTFLHCVSRTQQRS